MNKNILNFIEKCEGWKVGIKSLHWDAKNLSQHKLCDDIASAISDFEDLVSEVEQSISGKLKLNGFTPKKYKVESLKSFVEDVISDSKVFLDKLEKMGDNYIGIKSECETFIGVMQRNLYLVNFTLKEELKNRIKSQLSEAMYKNVDEFGDVDKLIGRRPKSLKSRINQIYKLVHKYGIDSRLYHDEGWQAIRDYHKVISSIGCDVDIKPCANLGTHGFESMESDGGYTDYDANDNMPRSKQYAIRISFDDGMIVDGYIKCMAAGTVEDPFSRYDTCMVLWPKSNKVLENKDLNQQIKLTESELNQVIEEATVMVLEGINIDPKNKGKFTATKKATGKSTEELTHSKNPLTRKRAIFAQNAKQWSHKKKSE